MWRQFVDALQLISLHYVAKKLADLRPIGFQSGRFRNFDALGSKERIKREANLCQHVKNIASIP